MTKFNYTHHRSGRLSTAVKNVFYNQNTKELAVDLHDDVYVYKQVPLASYEVFITSPSLGRAFQKVKANYGPGKCLGYNANVVFVTEGADAPSMDAIPSLPARDSRGRFVSAAVGTPKGLTYAENAVVTDVSSGPHLRVTLGENASADEVTNGIIRPHTVLFNVDGLGDRTYNTEATSVEQAISHLLEATNALALTVNVKEVTVSFE